MTSRPHRHLTIVHLMVATVVIALSLTVWRSLCLNNPFLDPQTESFKRYYWASTFVVLLLIPLSLLLLSFGIQGTRRRRLPDEPAFVVGFTVLTLSIYHGITKLPKAGSLNHSYLDPWLHVQFCGTLGFGVGLVLGVAWLMQAVSGRARRPRDWVGAAGIVLGSFWIALLLFHTVIEVAPYAI